MTLAQRVRTLSISLLMATLIGGCIGSAHTEQTGQISSAAETVEVAIQEVQTATPLDTEAVRQEIIRGANEERAKVGLSPLRVDSTLMEVAQERAHEISADFDHYGSGGEVRAAAITQGLGYSGQVGENCALRHVIRTSSGPTPKELAELVMQGWMSSSGHRTNILLERYAALGVGVHVSEHQLYAVQVFGTQ